MGCCHWCPPPESAPELKSLTKVRTQDVDDDDDDLDDLDDDDDGDDQGDDDDGHRLADEVVSAQVAVCQRE